jgi:uncharacterized protein YaaN involved in tellurite resistance
MNTETKTATAAPLALVPLEQPVIVIDHPEQLTGPDQKRVAELVAKINLNDIQSILSFGVEAQRKVTTQAEAMIEGVRNKDTGPAGEALNQLVTQVRGLGIDDLDQSKDNPITKFFRKMANPLAKFIQRYEKASTQMDAIVNKLEDHKMQLLRDVTLLDNLYQASLAQFHDLELYILAGEQKLQECNTVLLPALQAKAAVSGDMVVAQEARDAAARRDDLERKVQDLKLTRMATLQSLPQIRVVQDVDKTLVTKIQTSVMTTIPIWKAQVALAISLYRQQAALETQKKVADTTNELLRKNAELVQQNNSEARKEIERGVIDIETLKVVNDRLLATIQDTIQITGEARDKRISAAREMIELESNLKSALKNAAR